MKTTITKTFLLNIVKSLNEVVETKDIRPILQCINIKIYENYLLFSATDSYKLNQIKVECEIENNELLQEINIKSKDLLDLVKIIKDENITLLVENECCYLNNYQIDLFEGCYPKLDYVFKEYQNKINVNININNFIKELKALKHLGVESATLTLSTESSLKPIYVKDKNNDNIKGIILPVR